MVKITNGVNRMTVTAGVFREIYGPQGWNLVDDNSVQSPNSVTGVEGDVINAGGPKDTSLETTDSPVKTPEADLLDGDETDEEEDDESEDEEPDEDEELSEKPMSEMSYEELVQHAKTFGINAAGMRSKKEIREAITKKKH